MALKNDNAEEIQLLRENPDLVNAAVDEVLRFEPITPFTARMTFEEVEFRDVLVPAQTVVMISTHAANRDPELLSDPDKLDITRGAMGHLAFGHGIHHCLGAPLARMEMRIAFPALLRRFPRLAAAVPFEEVPFRAFHFVYGLHSLPVTW